MLSLEVLILNLPNRKTNAQLYDKVKCGNFESLRVVTKNIVGTLINVLLMETH